MTEGEKVERELAKALKAFRRVGPKGGGYISGKLGDYFDRAEALAAAAEVATQNQPNASGPLSPSASGLREALEAAFTAGAMSVHKQWVENPGEAPRGDPEFGEAATDYAKAALSRSVTEEGEAGPVAWLFEKRIFDEWRTEGWVKRVSLDKPANRERAALKRNIQPLYTHPAPPVAPADCAKLYVGDGLFALCDWADWPTVAGYWWHLTSRREVGRYAQTHSCHNSKTRRRIVMHNLILPPAEGQFVDHINGDGLDNRRANLRHVTRQQNAWNQRGHGGSSAFKGVSYRRAEGTWRAFITKDGKRTWLGTFATEIDAARAYNAAARTMFGEYALLNNLTATSAESAPHDHT